MCCYRRRHHLDCPPTAVCPLLAHSPHSPPIVATPHVATPALLQWTPPPPSLWRGPRRVVPAAPTLSAPCPLSDPSGVCPTLKVTATMVSRVNVTRVALRRSPAAPRATALIALPSLAGPPLFLHRFRRRLRIYYWLHLLHSLWRRWERGSFCLIQRRVGGVEPPPPHRATPGLPCCCCCCCCCCCPLLS